MNRQIPRIGAAIVCATVFLFAACLIVDFSFGAYIVCMLLPLGYIMMAAGFQHEAEEDRKVAANVGLVFSAVYACWCTSPRPPACAWTGWAMTPCACWTSGGAGCCSTTTCWATA